MAQERLILAIGRIERALTRLENVKIPVADESDLSIRHEALKSETRAAIRDIDILLNQGGN
jgi:hypothetical protein